MAIAMMITVCALFVAGIFAYFAAKNALSHEDFNRLRAQLAENEKTFEGRERNRRFAEFLRVNGIG